MATPAIVPSINPICWWIMWAHVILITIWVLLTLSPSSVTDSLQSFAVENKERPVRATITLYPIGRPVTATVLSYGGPDL